jgi:Cytochrome c7 and related cytochrome c
MKMTLQIPPRIVPEYGSHKRLAWGIGALALVLVLGGVFFLLASGAQAAPQQPIAFKHEVMVQAGVPCLFCHTEAMKSADAGMPSVEKCVGCHRTIAPDSPEIQKVLAYWKEQKPIEWVRVNQLPRFVYFSHEVHVVGAGLNCETCHGDVGHMTVTYAPIKMTMGFCLSCHEKQTNAPQLMDCITCHK